MTSRSDQDHVASARVHAKRRALERYGVDLPDWEIDEHEAMIRHMKSRQIGHHGRRSDPRYAEMHEVRFNDRVVFAVYRPRLRCIVTYLKGPADWLGKFTRSR